VENEEKCSVLYEIYIMQYDLNVREKTVELQDSSVPLIPALTTRTLIDDISTSFQVVRTLA